MSDHERVRDAVQKARQQMRRERGDGGDLADKVQGLDEFRRGVSATAQRFNDNWPEDEQPPWFLGLLGKEYGLGGLIDELGFSTNFFYRLGQKIEREIGANISGEVAGYEKVRTTIPVALKTIDKRSGGKLADFGENLKKHPAIQIVSYYLRLGHLDGLRTFQNGYGLSVVNRVLANSEKKQPPNFEELVRQLEGCYEVIPEQLKGEAKKYVQNHATYPTLSAYLRDNRKIPIEVPNEDRLFESTRTIPQERRIHYAPGGLLAKILVKFQNKVTDETFNGLERWTGLKEARNQQVIFVNDPVSP